MLKAVLFDLDDTLFDHRLCSRNALEQVRIQFPFFNNINLDEMEKIHLRLLDEIHLSYVLANKMTLEEARAARFNLLLKYTGNEQNEFLAKEIAIFYNQCYENGEWTPIPGALELLNELKLKYKIGVISNNFTQGQIKKIEKCGLTSLIDEIVTSEDTGFTKPDKKIFWILLNKMNVSSGEAVMIGDAWKVDILGAVNAGIKPVWFNRHNLTCPKESICRILTSFIPPLEAVKVIESVMF
jgi:HAD superfamily hydrolase (TIGR01549 family)